MTRSMSYVAQSSTVLGFESKTRPVWTVTHARALKGSLASLTSRVQSFCCSAPTFHRHPAPSKSPVKRSPSTVMEVGTAKRMFCVVLRPLLRAL